LDTPKSCFVGSNKKGPSRRFNQFGFAPARPCVNWGPSGVISFRNQLQFQPHTWFTSSALDHCPYRRNWTVENGVILANGELALHFTPNGELALHFTPEPAQ